MYGTITQYSQVRMSALMVHMVYGSDQLLVDLCESSRSYRSVLHFNKCSLTPTLLYKISRTWDISSLLVVSTPTMHRSTSHNIPYSSSREVIHSASLLCKVGDQHQALINPPLVCNCFYLNKLPQWPLKSTRDKHNFQKQYNINKSPRWCMATYPVIYNISLENTDLLVFH